MSYKVVEWLRILEFGMPMALSINTKAARILGVTLLSTAASTLAGCASTSFTDSRSAQDTAISKDMPSMIGTPRHLAALDPVERQTPHFRAGKDSDLALPA
jgi:hypothetical protein